MVHQLSTPTFRTDHVCNKSLCIYSPSNSFFFVLCVILVLFSFFKSFGFTVTHCSIVLRLIVFSLCRYTSAGIAQLFSDFGVDVGIMSAVCKIAFGMLSLDIVLCAEFRFLL